MADKKLDDNYFKNNGFNVSKEPFTKQASDGLATVKKKYRKGGSGKYDGYTITMPCDFNVVTEGDIHRIDAHYYPHE